MANDTPTSGVNQTFELVAPVKILVKPGFSSTGAKSSIRRRSLTSVPPYDSFSGSDQATNRGESENIFLVTDDANTPRQGEGRSETTLQIENIGLCQSRTAGYYMHHCFRLMYLSGMSTYDPEAEENLEEESWATVILRGIQKIIFWKVTSASLIFSGLNLKQFCLLFEAGKGVPKLVYVGSWLFTIVSEIYYTYLFAFCHKRIKQMMIALRMLGYHPIENITGKWKCKNPIKIITLMFVVSISLCFMYPMGRFGIQKWSPKKLMLVSSETLSNRLFIWSPNDFTENSTKLPTLHEEYGTSLTTMTVLMGLTEIGMRFCSNMKMDTALNMCIVAAVLMWTRNRHFGNKVKNINFKNCANDMETLDSPTGLFAEFQQMRKENRILNRLVGGLLKIIHGYNLMQCTTFLMRCLDHRATVPEFAFLVYNLMKVGVMYYFGKKAAAFNDVYEQWIIDWSMHSTNKIFLGRVPAILHEMKNGPLGLGRGHFLVGQGFIFRFLGFVGSIFMLEVDDDDE